MPAPHTQLTLLQRTSRPQSLDKQQFEESSAAAQASASHVAHDASSTTPTPPPPSGLAPLAGPSDYSTVGEAQDKHTGRSDMSQALLDNTAALEGNLSAAQRGDDVDFGEAEALGSAAGTAQPATALQPTATGPASGAIVTVATRCCLHPVSCRAGLTETIVVTAYNCAETLYVVCMQTFRHRRHHHHHHSSMCRHCLSITSHILQVPCTTLFKLPHAVESFCQVNIFITGVLQWPCLSLLLGFSLP